MGSGTGLGVTTKPLWVSVSFLSQSPKGGAGVLGEELGWG